MPADAELPETRDAFEAARPRIQADVVSYPAAMAACDVYFNDLLEQRGRIRARLAGLEAADTVC